MFVDGQVAKPTYRLLFNEFLSIPECLAIFCHCS